jgi:hypothetical protein
MFGCLIRALLAGRIEHITGHARGFILLVIYCIGDQVVSPSLYKQKFPLNDHETAAGYRAWCGCCVALAASI